MNRGYSRGGLHRLALLLLVAYAFTLAPMQIMAKEGGAPVHFDCGGGYTLSVTFGDSRSGEPEARIQLPDGRIDLPNVRSGSGARYANEGAELWTKGDEALLNVMGREQKRCRVSK